MSRSHGQRAPRAAGDRARERAVGRVRAARACADPAATAPGAVPARAVGGCGRAAAGLAPAGAEPGVSSVPPARSADPRSSTPACGAVAAPAPARARVTPARTPVADPRHQPAVGDAPPADTCAIIAAGGLGERFGDARGKQYVELCGLPVLAWSLMAFDRAPSVDHIVVACPAGREAQTRDDVLLRLRLATPVTLARAGGTRQESVAAGLDVAAAVAAARGRTFDLLAVHDGARPLVTPQAIEAVLAALRADATLAGAIAAAPVSDTLKLAEGGVVVSTPDRSFYWSAMTPQAFRADALVAAHAAAAADGFEGTDDASLVERRGGRVRCVACPRDNLKVTVPEDLALAEALLRARLAKEGGFADC